jgi:NAD(P)-dependent dehydrogenase (short-subunit alcohol dehydrogenase family)
VLRQDVGVDVAVDEQAGRLDCVQLERLDQAELLEIIDQVLTESIPLKRWGEVEDIAHLAIFLASDESSYIHGYLVKVDGGETLCRYSV